MVSSSAVTADTLQDGDFHILDTDRRMRVCSQVMTRTMMLTGLDDMTVARIRHWADVHGTTPSDYLVRLVDLHDRLDGDGQIARRRPARRHGA